ncbi:MAG: hypothetical protein OHK0013_05290 [Sandaracinaceae bacterium]
MRLPRLFFVIALAAPLAAAPALAQDRGAATEGQAARPGAGMHHGRGGHPGGPFGGHHGPGDDGPGTPDERFERRFQHVVGSLGLDEAQAAQVRQIMTEGRAQHEALAAQRLTGDEMRARHRQILEQNGQRIRALLRPDQQRVFDFHAARMRAAGDRMERGEPGPLMRRGGHHLRELVDSLGLDDAQRTQVQQIMQEGRAQHEALQGQAMTGEERRARHRQILEQNGQRIRQLLRPEQQQVFDAHVARMRQRFEAGGAAAGPHGRGHGRDRGPTAPSSPPSGI